MSKELVRYGQKAIMKSDESIKRDAGKGLMVIGTGGLGLWMLAGVLPFISLPFLLVAAVLGGLFLYVK